MKKYGMLFLTVLFSVCGCHPTVTEYGIEYEALTSREQEALIVLARATLAHNTKRGVISAAENQFAHEKDPDFTIHYNGDRQGTAKVRWQMPARLITIVFEGEFLKPQMNYIMQIQDKGPEMIDMRLQKYAPKEQKLEKSSKQKVYRSIAPAK